MRLLLVTETYPPEVNGVARTLGRWVQAFRKRGHEVFVIRPRQPGESPHSDLVYGLSLPFYKEVRLGIAGPVRLVRKLRRLRPDLVHIATEGPLGLSALLASLWWGVPIASSFHTNFDYYAAHYGLLGIEKLAFAYLRWFHNRTGVTLVPSQATASSLRERGVQRVEIWSRGVDGSLFHPRHRDEQLRASLGLGPEDPLLLYVGRLAPEKNLSALLQAFARLRSRLAPSHGEKLRLALVGSGPLADALSSTEQPGVILAGVHSGESLSRWYASADIFAFPSLSETFGNVVLEAQASGLAVVGFDCQGVNEQVIPNLNGILMPIGGDLSVPLARLCQDRPLRQRFGVAARARAENLDWKPIFDQLEERYLGMIQR
jgi:glycosyltransferase involved in cell wall biosynthesis